MTNLDIGVRRAMIASLVATGVSEQAATIRVTDEAVAAGVAYTQAQFHAGSARDGDDVRWRAAFQALKAWTPSHT